MHAINVIFIIMGIFIGVLLIVLLIDVSYSDKMISKINSFTSPHIWFTMPDIDWNKKFLPIFEGMVESYNSTLPREVKKE